MNYWQDIEDAPEEEFILLSIENYTIPIIGMQANGAFYAGDDSEPLIKHDLIVNGWMKLPRPRRDE